MAGGNLTKAWFLKSRFFLNPCFWLEFNQVRSRADLSNTTATTQTALALAVLNERRLELVFENNRWNDLKRADKNGIVNVVDIMNNQKNYLGQPLGYYMATDKHQLIFPIPNQDRQLNSNLTQNPGY